MTAKPEVVLTEQQINEFIDWLLVDYDGPEDDIRKLNIIRNMALRSAEAGRDAKRYRWLRTNREVTLLTRFFGTGCVNRRIEEVDAAIDAAMEGK